MKHQGEQFVNRHIGPTSSDEEQMLQVLGYSDIKKFISDVVPKNIQLVVPLSLLVLPVLVRLNSPAHSLNSSLVIQMR